MNDYLNDLLKFLRPAFSRNAAYCWFVTVFIGFIMRSDTYGVSSIVRALWLAPACYPCLLHFFHSSAWDSLELLKLWWQWLPNENMVLRVNERIVFAGDHTKFPKEGRRMPLVTTLHQDSETSSKPTFFRGHHWGFIGLILEAGSKFFASPLWAEIHNDECSEKRSTRIVSEAAKIAQGMGEKAYLVLDAFFAVGPVFIKAKELMYDVHIITRAKRNVVAYKPVAIPEKKSKGRPKMYGEKLHLYDLFDSHSTDFQPAITQIYQKFAPIQYLALDLLWKPTQSMIRFILISSLAGRIVLMTSDLELDPVKAIKLYSNRTSIETFFHRLKNILGGMGYHFWSKYLMPVSRNAKKNKDLKPVVTNPASYLKTIKAIEKFVHIQMLVVGVLQLISIKFNLEVYLKSNCWLRTSSGTIPSEFITLLALRKMVLRNIITFPNDGISQIIRSKREAMPNGGHLQKNKVG